MKNKLNTKQICHGAAIVYQAAASDTCNAEAEDCQNAHS